MASSYFSGLCQYFDWHHFLYYLGYHFCVLMTVMSGIGMTAGYHRLWAHRSYQATTALRFLLATWGAAAHQGSILWWTHYHRTHHRYVDTKRDPSNAKRGLLWSHMGWKLTRFDRHNWGKVSMLDVEADPVVVWQEQYYWVISHAIGTLLPVLVAHYGWGDWQGGLLYGCCTRVVLSWHGTGFVSSLSHWWGSQPYSTEFTARENAWVGLLTFGEGYHNFHHQFPSDYRNGVRWYDLDPTKWVIWLWGQLGWASNLHRVSTVKIEESRRLQLQSQSTPRSTAPIPLQTK